MAHLLLLEKCILVLCFTLIDFVKGFCPTDNSEWNRRSAIFSCETKGDGFRYHCLLDTEYKTQEFCQISVYVHPADGCPVYLNWRSFDFRPCSGLGCPQIDDQKYQLTDLWKYPACLTPLMTSRARKPTTDKTTQPSLPGDDLQNGKKNRQSNNVYATVGGAFFLILLACLTALNIYLFKTVRKTRDISSSCFLKQGDMKFHRCSSKPEFDNIYEEIDVYEM